MNAPIDKDSDDTIVSFQKATLRIRQRLILPDTDWVVKRYQHWAILGPNGAGKSTLVRALAGEVPVVRGTLWPPDGGSFRKRFAYVSFDQHKYIAAREDQLDEARWYSGNIADWTTVKDYLTDKIPPGTGAAALTETLTRLKAEELLHCGIRHLSNGEMRKVLIARALLRDPEILILDEPYNGLDREASQRLAVLIDDLTAGPRPVILVTHRVEEIPSGTSHLLGIKNGRVIFQGPKDEMLTGRNLRFLYSEGAESSGLPMLSLAPEADRTWNGPVFEMRDAVVKYRTQTVIRKLNWTVQAGENWALLGPNGSGKSTLLSLIYADNPQAYANDVKLFGKRRGCGESIWEVKKNIGLVSTELQVRYRKKITALEVVLSGFFDSVGLYRRPEPAQIEVARHWMHVIGVGSMAERSLDQLSNGEQRLVLIARSLVKSPRVLMLDEPAQGLDPVNRRRILAAVDAACARSPVSLIFVTHHPGELPGCITHLMKLVPSNDGSTGQIRILDGGQ